jgi:hypothetical protein
MHYVNFREIPTDLLPEAVRELVTEINSVQTQILHLNQFECTSSFFGHAVQDLEAELEDLKQDLETELAIARAVPRFRRKKKTAPAPVAPSVAV